nr:hypothetical protein [Tanacetum cinerariifolium]
MEEMDLRWQIALLTIMARRFLKKIRRKLTVNGNETIDFDKSNMECYNCHKRGHFVKESLVSCNGLGRYDWSDLAEEGPNYALMAFTSSSSDSEVSNDSTCSKSCLETVKLLKSQNDQLLKDIKKSELMVLVPPPYIGNFMPPTHDLSFNGLDKFVNKPIVKNYKDKSSKKEPKVVRKNEDAPVIKEWMQDNEEEDVSQPKNEKNTGNPQMDLHDQEVIDSRCSRHMTGNMFYLTDYKEIDGRYVASGGNPKGWKITRKGTQSNGFACTKASDNVDLKSSNDDGSKPTSDDGKKVDENPRNEIKYKDQEKEDNVHNTNNVNTISSTINIVGTNRVNVIGENISIELQFD